MKKLIVISLVVLTSLSLFAENINMGKENSDSSIYGIGACLFGYASSTNVYGINFGIPTTRKATNNLYGLDLTLLISKIQNVNGVQLSLISNKPDSLNGFQSSIFNVADETNGVQFGIVNMTKKENNNAYQFGIVNFSKKENNGAQIGVVNTEVTKINGTQLGLFNISKSINGLQFGLFNNNHDGSNIQVGLLNYNKSSIIPYFPLVNFSFK